jgi:tetratricopeptide (TPR) repeat protein
LTRAARESSVRRIGGLASLARVRRQLEETRAALVCVIVALALVGACSKRLEVPDAVYREAVSAFYTGLAAMQTSQEVLARQKLERVTVLVPGEPAAWANLGLLLLRQQELESAGEKIAKAAALAPKSGPIQRLLALVESRKGNLPQSIGHWRKALDLDPNDRKAAFALAQETERQGGPENEAEAQRVLAALLARSENLAARLDYARLAAKNGDGATLQKAIAALGVSARSWPPEAQEQLQALQQAASANPRSAATRVAFLKNVLVRVPEYRRALAAVLTPRDEIGEPLLAFLALKNPEPQPAPPDEALTFTVERVRNLDAAWVGVVSSNGEGAPSLAIADGKSVTLPASGARPASMAFPGGNPETPPGPDGVLAADLNGDYRTDLTLAGAGGVTLLRQDDKGAFSDVSAAAKLPPALLRAAANGAWAADVDTDGDLDIVLAPVDGAPVVLRNNGDGTFDQRRPFSGVERLRGFAWADFDGEGVPDAALLQADGSVRVFLNQRGGEFRERPVPPGFPKAVALVAAEANGDSLFDVLALTATGAIVRLSQKPNGVEWESAQLAQLDAVPPGLQVGSARLIAADLDNNGAIDLVISGATSSRVLLGGQGLAFKPLAAPLAMSVGAAADLDGDGRLELVGRGAGGAVVEARSRGAKAYHWQSLRPRSATATGDQRINSFGIGGELEVRTALHAQKQVINSPVVHFGLGDAAQADVVRITWPNGILQSEFDKAADATLLAQQRLKGSCPWLFAWNGRELGFVTDLLWRSPLGLRINAQATADVVMTEDRVKIRGDQLVARNGSYDLRITAELWETHFFDFVSLLVVDHEPGTEVFVDERFAIPAPKLDVIATGPLRELAAVRDDGGHDVSEIARARDGRHLDFAGRGTYQGVTREHFVEVELPEDAPRHGPLWLVAQGWIHPTDSSINVALSQGSAAAPRGLTLQVADRAGRFHVARAGLGFPAGKDKTVLLDLSGLFPPAGPRRARVATNLEIYWDRLAWAVGRPDVHPQTRRIAPAGAELRYRGYSVTEQPNFSTPERPRYVLAGTSPRWRDLEGYHTRFGDVQELLSAVDDRYVIMNAGDEIALQFPASAAVAGSVRDFVLVADGWVKDGDFNTTFSRTVLPLPAHANARYETAPRRLEDDPVYLQHRDDFEKFHTRYVSPERTRDALRANIDADR